MPHDFGTQWHVQKPSYQKKVPQQKHQHQGTAASSLPNGAAHLCDFVSKKSAERRSAAAQLFNADAHPLRQQSVCLALTRI